eukprot:c11431_g1_i4.p1 GENE.c11431_g1_i4~~c11431_g1_i4.p1  ORF type:complete len:205 (+),score=26.65 c11431_g1_i4:39-617(+)
MDTPLVESAALQFESELEALVNEVSKGVSALRNLSGRERDEKVAALKKRVQHGETLYRSAQNESRELDQTTRRQVQTRTKNMYTTLKRLQTDLENQASRTELMGGRGALFHFGSADFCFPESNLTFVSPLNFQSWRCGTRERDHPQLLPRCKPPEPFKTSLWLPSRDQSESSEKLKRSELALPHSSPTSATS